jgi:hypothetical protein
VVTGMSLNDNGFGPLQLLPKEEVSDLFLFVSFLSRNSWQGNVVEVMLKRARPSICGGELERLDEFNS